MKNAIFCSVVAVSVACSTGPKATAAECQTGCQRATELRLASQKEQMASKLHEADEQVDATEEESAKQAALVKQQMAEGGPPWNPKAFAKQPAKVQRELAARHQWDARQLKLQQELALQRIQDAIAESKKHYQDIKAQAEADEKMKSCADACLGRPAKFAQCLGRAQAIEDLAACEKK
jgi:hypothetical protein